jgi:translation initiation factor eIF-2B subunit delta
MPTIPAVFLPAAAAAAVPVAPAPTSAPDAGEPTNETTAESAKKPRKPVPPEYENKVFEKRPVLSKAERRAKQEAQVAAKQEAKGGLPPAGPSKAKAPAAAAPSVASSSPHASALMDNSKSPGMTGRARSGSAPVVPVFALPPGQVSAPIVSKPLEVSSKRTKSAGQEVFLRQEVAAQQRSNMFAHLPSFRRVNIEDAQLGYTVDDVHPAMIRLGLKFASGAIAGSIARCVAFVEAVQLVLEDFECDSEKPFGAEWNAHLGRVGIRFLINCRPMSVSMGSALKHFKSVAKSLDANGITSKPQCKEIMRQVLVDFLEARVVAAHSVIVGHVYNTLVDGDVILTYAHSNIVESLLAYAFSF